MEYILKLILMEDLQVLVIQVIINIYILIKKYIKLNKFI
jgi:hypothetical protein